ncbi:uncharacterized protein KQ657_001820 [Scheffersomyces spartinae]|uniref:Protein phosphatase n=1 Tax=Scheffersomyces spartinae TaxID=45513 RepID=A0A9P8AHR3_9ASCO|nr:uncharacterized protein KQ657_001820 [Scheffersomyces spartinae]KAG7192419.1 hypothetical protein KQ657_001820 [Scheffersomyces spartinae]
MNRSGSDDPPVEVNPYIRYPIITKDQMKTIANDKFKFEYGYASYGHHTSNSDPTIHSLSDLTDPTQLKSLLPQRRPEGSPIDTLSVKAGDDAMLVSPTVLAVADGVSGWELKHENSSSGIWSRSMLETLSRLMTEYKVSHSPHHLHKRDIDQILDDSYLHTSHQMDLQQLGGSSTLILCMLSGIYLQIISIGDSKLYLIRDGDIIKTNDEQMISPLCPQQIGTHTLSHMPSEIAWVDSIELQKDDIIVVCSDGISDNLYPHEILEFVNHNLNSKKNNLKAVARIILSKAKTVGFDDYAYTPYNEKVNNLPNSMRNDTVSAGGKLDDMSVCIAKVIPNGNI